MVIAVLAVYALLSFVLLVFALNQAWLLWQSIRSRNQEPSKNTAFQKKPFVTIQLPIYNEPLMVERLLKAIAQIKYPKELLEIQVLDDSTDETRELVQKEVEKWSEIGVFMNLLQRNNRDGFKAGALREGLAVAKGELVAIFDADFLPTSDWLEKVVNHFHDENIGMVQTRWGHINEHYSWLTRFEAMALDAHFFVDQKGRSASNLFFNFNGTAGIWRKSCMIDAGNWQADTLTEDLDLSYRAQIKGWKFNYIHEIVTPAELPITVDAVRNQQFRWNKGSAQNLLKLLPLLFAAKQISWKLKLQGFFHLTSSLLYPISLLLAILSVPVLYFKHVSIPAPLYYQMMSVLLLASLVFFSIQWRVYMAKNGGGIIRFFKFLPLFVGFYVFIAGITLYNSIAVFEAIIGKPSAFLRTPKFNVQANLGFKMGKTSPIKFPKVLVLELILMFYFVGALFGAFRLNDFGLLPFHFIWFVGFGAMLFQSLKEWGLGSRIIKMVEIKSLRK